MGRPTGGSRGGGGHSSGGHSSLRSSGGHRVGGRPAGGGRPTGGGSSSGHRTSYGGGYRHGYGRGASWYRGRRYHTDHSHHYTYVNTGGSRGGLGGVISAAFTFILIIVILLFISFSTKTAVPASTYEREKLNTGIAFQNDCIYDEEGWFDNESRTERDLKHFYDKTGIQPQIVIKAYDPSITLDADREAYARDWYEENIFNESTFLFMYFSESSPDDVGYMCYVNGKETDAIMDSEAIEIFWGYIDSYWYNDSYSTDQVFVKAFTATANRIMEKTKTVADYVPFLIIAVLVIAVLIIAYKAYRVSCRRKAEEAAETERILNADLNTMADDLASKYEKEN